MCRSPLTARTASYSYTSVKLVVGGGFEPPKSYDDRFTVCSLWPLGNPTTLYKNAKRSCRNRKKERDLHRPPESDDSGNMEFILFRHSKIWSWRWESNPQPADYKSAALPVELHQQTLIFWCLGADLNHRHRDFQSLALPTELPRHIWLFLFTATT